MALESLFFETLQLDSGFRWSDKYGKTLCCDVIPAEAETQDRKKIRSLSRLVCARWKKQKPRGGIE
jgi:hypothetical protein